MKFHILCWTLMLTMLGLIVGTIIITIKGTIPLGIAAVAITLLAANAWIFATAADQHTPNN